MSAANYSRKVALAITALVFLLGWSGAHAQDAFGISSGFVENRGQVDASVRYYATGSNVGLYFTTGAIVIDVGAIPPPTSEPSVGDEQPQEQTMKRCALWLNFDGANPSPIIEAREKLPFYFNYLVGSDESQWRTEVPAFTQVVYRELWPGIDLAFSLEGEALSYTVDASAGADLARIRFRCEGADNIAAIAGTEEQFVTPFGTLIHSIPDDHTRCGRLAWSCGAGEAAGEPAAADLSESNASTLVFSTFLGGSSADYGEDVVHDRYNNVFVTGQTISSDFPVTSGAYDIFYFTGSNGDAFVAKINPSGTSLLWCTYLGGNGEDKGLGIGVDGNCFAIVVGYTYSTDFPTTTYWCYDRTANGSADGFVTKLNAGGSSLLNSTYFGGSGSDICRDVAVDYYGYPIVVGRTYSSNFPTYLAPTPSTSWDYDANGDGFIFSLNSGILLYSSFIPGVGMDDCMAVDMYGREPVVIGSTSSGNLNTTVGAYDRTLSGSSDAFVMWFQPPGTRLTLKWGTYLGGAGQENGNGIVINMTNPVTAVVTGWTKSSDFPHTTGPAYSALEDGFVTRFNNAGNGLLWSRYLGGSGSDQPADIAMQGDYNPVVVGFTNSSNFPTTSSAYDPTYNGDFDCFVTKLNSTATSILCSTYLGTTRADYGKGVDLPNASPLNPAVVGNTSSAAFPITPTAPDRVFAGATEAFVTKLPAATYLTDDEQPSAKLVDMGTQGPRAVLSLSSSPFVDFTSLHFALPEAAEMSVAVYDVQGREMQSLLRGSVAAGSYDLRWDGRDKFGRPVPAGTYFCRVAGGGIDEVCRLVRLSAR